MSKLTVKIKEGMSPIHMRKKRACQTKTSSSNFFYRRPKSAAQLTDFFKGEIAWGAASFCLGQFVSLLSWLVRSSLENSGFVWKC